MNVGEDEVDERGEDSVPREYVEGGSGGFVCAVRARMAGVR